MKNVWHSLKIRIRKLQIINLTHERINCVRGEEEGGEVDEGD